MKKKGSLLFVISVTLNSSTFANIEVLNPWIRPSTGENATLFMEVVNTSDKPDELVNARTKTASSTELCSDIKEGNKKSVQKVNFITIPPKGNTVLDPQGRHIELQKINRPLKAGDKVDVTLWFKNGENVNISVPVKNEEK